MTRNETEVPAPYERDHRRVAIAFAGVLKLARTGAGLSQDKLAEVADIDRTYPSLLGSRVCKEDRRQQTPRD